MEAHTPTQRQAWTQHWGLILKPQTATHHHKTLAQSTKLTDVTHFLSLEIWCEPDTRCYWLCGKSRHDIWMHAFYYWPLFKDRSFLSLSRFLCLSDCSLNVSTKQYKTFSPSLSPSYLQAGTEALLNPIYWDVCPRNILQHPSETMMVNE